MPQAIRDPILKEAAALAKLDREQLVIVRAESVVWNDGSLGCPEPEMMYTQALVNGYWVVIDASGQNYDFRVDNRGNFRLCPPGPRPSSITAYRKLTPGAAVRRREQLQRRVARLPRAGRMYTQTLRGLTTIG